MRNLEKKRAYNREYYANRPRAKRAKAYDPIFWAKPVPIPKGWG